MMTNDENWRKVDLYCQSFPLTTQYFTWSYMPNVYSNVARIPPRLVPLYQLFANDALSCEKGRERPALYRIELKKNRGQQTVWIAAAWWTMYQSAMTDGTNIQYTVHSTVHTEDEQ